ncbi:unnamed protein product [Fusarium graminearum]|nr:unnamed protein product [Fusarium graminearum]VTO87172.1 unnamed protein product [Fusarium graminearum]
MGLWFLLNNNAWLSALRQVWPLTGDLFEVTRPSLLLNKFQQPIGFEVDRKAAKPFAIFHQCHAAMPWRCEAAFGVEKAN